MNMSDKPDDKAEQDVSGRDERDALQTGQSSGEETHPVKESSARTGGKKQSRRRETAASRKNWPTLLQVTDRFAACGRCSYFWAGYRVLQGEAALQTAVSQSKSGWLQLIWDLQMPELIHKSFGVRLDISHFHYEGCCKECRRHFIYQAAENEEETDNFQIEISPRLAK